MQHRQAGTSTQGYLVLIFLLAASAAAAAYFLYLKPKADQIGTRPEVPAKAGPAFVSTTPRPIYRHVFTAKELETAGVTRMRIARILSEFVSPLRAKILDQPLITPSPIALKSLKPAQPTEIRRKKPIKIKKSIGGATKVSKAKAGRVWVLNIISTPEK